MAKRKQAQAKFPSAAAVAEAAPSLPPDVATDILAPGQEYHVNYGDVIPYMHTLPSDSIDLAVFSPPFPSVFSYTDQQADLGNSEDLHHEAPLHFSFFFRALLRVMKPGRVAVVHCTQIALLKRSGHHGMYDFRGLLIRLAQRSGWIYEYDWLVRVNPQAQAIRTKSRALQFAGLESDRAESRGAMGMALIKLRKPGENQRVIDTSGQVSRDEWINWAEPCWSDIRETDTLNIQEARDTNDTKHICPMQLGIYYRIIKLFSDPGELVFDPFTGIGSCGYVALGGKSPSTGLQIYEPRRFLGCELKETYHATALRNCERAIRQRNASQRTLFDSTPSLFDTSIVNSTNGEDTTA